MWLLLFLYPFLELYLLVQIGSRIGLGNTLFWLLASFVLGIGLVKSQGRYILAQMQGALSQGRVPTNEVLHGLVVFFGGVFLAIPGFLSDFIALILILPGTRHLIVRTMRKRFENQVASGKFQAFSFGMNTGFGGFGARGGMRRPGQQPGDDMEWSREVSPKVIDVSPVSSKTVEKPDDEI